MAALRPQRNGLGRAGKPASGPFSPGVAPRGARCVCSSSESGSLLQAPRPTGGELPRRVGARVGGFTILAGPFPGGGAQTPISFLLLAGSIQLGRRLFPLASETPARAHTSLLLQAPRCAQAPAAAWAAPGTRAGWRRAWSSGPVPATAFTG